MLSRITAADLVALGLMVALGVVLLGSAGGDGQRGHLLTIKNLRSEVVVHDLGEDARIEIEGAIGTTLIVVRNGRAAFVSSPCAHKLCVEKGPISRCGEWVLCLPNGVIAEISGEDDYDGITP